MDSKISNLALPRASIWDGSPDPDVCWGEHGIDSLGWPGGAPYHYPPAGPGAGTKDAQALPDHFIDGIPHRRVLVDLKADGRRVCESVEIGIPSDLPSLYWREGC